MGCHDVAASFWEHVPRPAPPRTAALQYCDAGNTRRRNKTSQLVSLLHECRIKAQSRVREGSTVSPFHSSDFSLSTPAPCSCCVAVSGSFRTDSVQAVLLHPVLHQIMLKSVPPGSHSPIVPSAGSKHFNLQTFYKVLDIFLMENHEYFTINEFSPFTFL